ncbi:hypothetical protein [Kitasatospora terrestris]|uniref:hypothetical protein n=1 Tax=Kitasatospora terrestris TaxID=258051 RepID=UPI0031EDDBBC
MVRLASTCSEPDAANEDAAASADDCAASAEASADDAAEASADGGEPEKFDGFGAAVSDEPGVDAGDDDPSLPHAATAGTNNASTPAPTATRRPPDPRPAAPRALRTRIPATSTSTTPPTRHWADPSMLTSTGPRGTRD